MLLCRLDYLKEEHIYFEEYFELQVIQERVTELSIYVNIENCVMFEVRLQTLLP